MTYIAREEKRVSTHGMSLSHTLRISCLPAVSRSALCLLAAISAQMTAMITYCHRIAGGLTNATLLPAC